MSTLELAASRLATLAAAALVTTTGCSQGDTDRRKQIVVWAMASSSEHWRADNAIDGMQELQRNEPEYTGFSVLALNDAGKVSDYKKKFTMAAEAGRGPDIVLSGHEDIPVWASAGYIAPLASSVSELLARFPALEHVQPTLWPSCLWNGQVWAIPQDVEARPLYFSKKRLAELGWSAADIESLPGRIQRGEYTLGDMLETARQAVARGVVQRGNGFWHRPRVGGDFLQFYVAFGGRLHDPDSDKLVLTRSALLAWFRFQREAVTSEATSATLLGTEWRIWHDTVARQNVLFWQGGSWSWADWAENYLAGSGGGDYLEANTGYALIPTGIPGGRGATLSHPMVYMVTRSSVSGQPHQVIAEKLLGHLITPTFDARHAVESAHLSILRDPSSDLSPDGATADAFTVRRRFVSKVMYMLDHNYYFPNNPYYPQYFDIIWENLVAVILGRKPAEEAATTTVAELETELGDDLVIE